jgi:serine/threonine protein kinase
MVACCSDNDLQSTTNRGLFTGIRHVVGTWFKKLQSVIRGGRRDISLNSVVIQQNSGGLVTPNHIPFNGTEHSQRKSIKADVSFTPIDLSKDPKSGKLSPPAKPTELWKAEQTTMLQGKYDLNKSFSTKYRLKQLLGEGSFGFVWVAERLRDHHEVAVKFILREKVAPTNWIFDGELGLVPLEVHFMKGIVHPNIIQYLDYYSDYRFCYLVTEMHGTSWTWPNPKIDATRNPGLRPPGQLLRLGQKEVVGVAGVTRRSPCDLFECIEAHGKLPEVTVYKIFSQIYEAVSFLYHRGIVHRDLKDENVVVDENYDIKIIDFGSASLIPRLKGSRASASVDMDLINADAITTVMGPVEGYFERFNGTLAFAAPEVIRGLRYRPSDAEVWSLGVLLYTMICKKSPFASTDAILHASLDLPHEDVPGVWDLVRKMLARNPVTRIHLDHIRSHPFMLKYTLKRSSQII